MALKNVLGSPYSVVTEVGYNQVNKHLHFSLNMWNSSDKTQLISEINYSLDGSVSAEAVGGVITDYPSEYSYEESPEDFDTDLWKTYPKYLVGAGGSGEFEGQAGMMFVCSGEVHSSITTPNPEGGRREEGEAEEETLIQNYAWDCIGGDHDKLYKIPDGTMYKLDYTKSSLGEIPVSTFTDLHWNEYFSIAAMDEEDTNIIRQIYLYLKSCPGFEKVVDA